MIPQCQRLLAIWPCRRLFSSLNPASVKSWDDLMLHPETVSTVKRIWPRPCKMQTKMLALTQCKTSVIGLGWPGSGKRSSLFIGLLESAMNINPHTTPDNCVQNLLLVKSGEEVQYLEKELRQLVPEFPNGLGVLYRVGKDPINIELDNSQHVALLKNHPKTIIATPQRIMDYLQYSPSSLDIRELKLLAISNLENHQAYGGGRVFIEYLCSHILEHARSPVFMWTSNLMGRKLAFENLHQIISNSDQQKKMKKVFVRPSENVLGKAILLNSNGEETDIKGFVATPGCASALTYKSARRTLLSLWKKARPSVLVVPHGLSSFKLKEAIADLPGSESVAILNPAAAGQLSFFKETTKIHCLGFDSRQLYLPKLMREMKNCPESRVYFLPCGYDNTTFKILETDLKIVSEPLAEPFFSELPDPPGQRRSKQDDLKTPNTETRVSGDISRPLNDQLQTFNRVNKSSVERSYKFKSFSEVCSVPDTNKGNVPTASPNSLNASFSNSGYRECSTQGDLDSNGAESGDIQDLLSMSPTTASKSAHDDLLAGQRGRNGAIDSSQGLMKYSQADRQADLQDKSDDDPETTDYDEALLAFESEFDANVKELDNAGQEFQGIGRSN